MLKMIRQPDDTMVCGQCCLAMLLGISLREIKKTIGHSRGTQTREIVTALNRYGVINSGKLLRICKKRNLPEIAIVKVKIKGWHVNGWHWILKHGAQHYDPYIGKGNFLPRCYQAISFIEIKGVQNA